MQIPVASHLLVRVADRLCQRQRVLDLAQALYVVVEVTRHDAEGVERAALDHGRPDITGHDDSLFGDGTRLA